MKRILTFIGCLMLVLGLFPANIQATSTSGAFPSSSQILTEQVSRSYDMYSANLYGMDHPVKEASNYFAISKFFVDNATGYCVQPDIMYFNGMNYEYKLTGGDAYNALKKNYLGLGYNDAQIAKLQQIASVGYGYNGDTSNDLYSATQILVWRVKHPNDIQTSSASIQAKINEIESRLQVFNKKVSFQNQTVVLKGYGKENAVKLTDSQQVFQQYNLQSSLPKGLHAQKDKNTLTIWADKPLQQGATLSFSSLYGNEGVNNALTVYTSGANQTLATFGRITAPSMSIQVQIDIHASKGNLILTKSAEQLDSVILQEDETVKEFVYAEKGLPNAEFDITAEEDIKDPLSDQIVYKKGDLVAHLVTDENGQGVVPDLFYGTYGITETKVPAGFVRNEEKQVVEIKGKETFNQVIDQQAAIFDQRQRIELKLLKTSTTDSKGIQGAQFALLADQDILDPLGNVLVAKGQVITRVTSNEKGKLNINMDLPIAQYVLKEEVAPQGHVLLEEPLAIAANGLKDSEHLFSMDQEISNQFELLELVVHKKDQETKKEINEDFEFALFEDKQCKKEVQRQKGKKAKATFTKLNAGTYYLKETQAPKDYVLSNEVHTIQITRQGEMYIDGDKAEKHEITITNEKRKEILPAVAPQIFTGYQTSQTRLLIWGLTGLSGCLAAVYVYQKKKRK